MDIGYARYAACERTEDTPEAVKERLGVEKVYIDYMQWASVSIKRPELDEMLDFIREGDTLTVETYSRLGRSVNDFLKIVRKLDKKGVRVISIREGLDTATDDGKKALKMFDDLLLLDKEEKGRRIADGVDASANHTGRKKKAIDWDEFSEIYMGWKNGDIKSYAGADKLGISIPTFYRRVDEYEKENGLESAKKARGRKAAVGNG